MEATSYLSDARKMYYCPRIASCFCASNRPMGERIAAGSAAAARLLDERAITVRGHVSSSDMLRLANRTVIG